MIHYIKSHLLRLLFPDSCLVCGNKNTLLCAFCIQKIFNPIHIYRVGNILALASYRNKATREILWFLKYKNGKRIAKIIAPKIIELLLAHIKTLHLENINFLIVPVPTTKDRVRKKGFNHAECLARAIANDLPSNYLLKIDIIKKIKRTKKQTFCTDRKERIKNLVGAFSITKTEAETIKGVNIIIIDDVTTTGATLNEIRSVFISAGARKVIGIAVAH